MSSAFSIIVLDVEKFAKGTGTDIEKLAKEFEVLWGKSPSALQTVSNFVNEAAPIVEAAVALADPIIEPEVAAGLAMAETGLAALSASAKSATSGTSVLANLQNFATTVPAVLTGIAVKNPALQAKVTAIVNLIVNEAKVLVPAVEAWVAKLATAAPATA